MIATTGNSPASSASRARCAARRACSTRACGEKPRSAESVRRRASPSSSRTVSPRSVSAPATSEATVDLPEQGRPVSQRTRERNSWEGGGHGSAPPPRDDYDVEPGVAGGLLAPAGGSVSAPSPLRSAPGAVFGGVTVAGVATGPTGLPYGVALVSSDDEDESFLYAATPPPAAIGISSSLTPRLPTILTTLNLP